METRDLINEVIKAMDIPYCGSCMCGCDNLTRFICLGKTTKDINEWIKNNPDKFNELESKYDI